LSNQEKKCRSLQKRARQVDSTYNGCWFFGWPTLEDLRQDLRAVRREAFSGLLEFAEKYHVTSAHFTAIGALNGATLGWFDPQRKMYKKIPINGQHEVIAMIGDIALYQGKPAVHTHMVVAGPDGTTRAGHVLAAFASPTLEVMVTVDLVK
jgi:predicted DNA-binding protein with PD1-like motif